jgi:hypothetical protein
VLILATKMDDYEFYTFERLGINGDEVVGKRLEVNTKDGVPVPSNQSASVRTGVCRDSRPGDEEAGLNREAGCALAPGQQRKITRGSRGTRNERPDRGHSRARLSQEGRHSHHRLARSKKRVYVLPKRNSPQRPVRLRLAKLRLAQLRQAHLRLAHLRQRDTSGKQVVRKLSSTADGRRGRWCLHVAGDRFRRPDVPT